MIFLKYVVKGKLRLIKVGKQFEECAVNREIWLPSQSQSGNIAPTAAPAIRKSAFAKLLNPLIGNDAKTSHRCGSLDGVCVCVYPP